MNRISWCSSRIRSFRNAVSGIRYNILNESNFRIHLVIAVAVVIAGFLVSLRRTEWIIVILTIGSVLAAEAMNTSVEKLCDRFSGEEDPKVKIVKDSSAAAVLTISIAAFVIGLVIFLPYILTFINDLFN
jgi:diacylglycerol kinase